MNILTFDIEDWFCHDNFSQNTRWHELDARIHKGVDMILEALERHRIKATFFCLGWIAEHQPEIIRKINDAGHHIGCHSYQHELVYRQDKKLFYSNTEKAKKLIEDLIGKEVNAYRAPAFTMGLDTLYALYALCQLGFKYDFSIVAAATQYGGIPKTDIKRPVIIKHNGFAIKEFPMSVFHLFGKPIIFSGGGYFRFLPYPVIKKMVQHSDYVVSYFHPSDFDVEKPDMRHLPLFNRWKNQAGVKSAYKKFNAYLSDFSFTDAETADRLIDWKEIEIKQNDKEQFVLHFPDLKTVEVEQ